MQQKQPSIHMQRFQGWRLGSSVGGGAWAAAATHRLSSTGPRWVAIRRASAAASSAAMASFSATSCGRKEERQKERAWRQQRAQVRKR
jgi:hypothetical protein